MHLIRRLLITTMVTAVTTASAGVASSAEAVTRAPLGVTQTSLAASGVGQALPGYTHASSVTISSTSHGSFRKTKSKARAKARAAARAKARAARRAQAAAAAKARAATQARQAAAAAAAAQGVSTPPPAALTALLAQNRQLQADLLDGLTRQQQFTSIRQGFASTSNAVRSQLLDFPYLATAVNIRCNTGTALMATSLAVATGSPLHRERAIRAFDLLLQSEKAASGALSGPLSASSPDINTMFFAVHLGTATLMLGESLPSAKRREWTSAVTGGADYLIRNGNLRWYTNGNIVIGNAMVMALAYRLSGDAKYLAAYDTAWTFATSPNQERWPGMGLAVTKRPTSIDSSDGRAYFVEAGKTAGYDPDYTMVQSELLARLFLLTRDPRVHSALNMVTNQLMLRLNPATMMYDASGGVRHNYPDPAYFDTSALPVLAFAGGRSDLARFTLPQALKTSEEFVNALNRRDFSDRSLWASGAITGTISLIGSSVALPANYGAFRSGS